MAAAAASLAVPFVRLRRLARLINRISSNDDDLSRLVDFNPSDMHTGRTDGFDRSGHVLLPECGRCASHIARYSTSRSSVHASGPEPEPSLLRLTAWRRVSTGQRCCTSGGGATAAARAFTSRAVP